MKFHVITKEQVEELSLKDFNLNTTDTTFLYYYSCYRFYLESYLKETLNLELLNNELQKFAIPNISNIYSEISCLNLANVFLRSDIFLDRLTPKEFEEYKNIYKEQDNNKMQEFIKNTYKKVISFTTKFENENQIIYSNYSLVIGVFANNNEELNKYLKEKETEFTSLLGIPVKIVTYSSGSIYELKNLNLPNELMNKEILKKYPKYLPLGSVVLLNRGWKKVMIMGFSPINMDNKEEVYDYLGCLYPEGIMRTDMNIVFNHDDIKQIIAIGLRDDEQKEFMNNIDKLIGEGKEKLKTIDELN